MGRPKGSGTKDPFESLPEEWKNRISGMLAEEINTVIAGVAKAEVVNQQNLATDLQVQECKARYDDSVAPYKKLTRNNILDQRIAMGKVDDVGLTKAVKAEAENQVAKKLDSNVETLKLELAESKAGYTEVTKANELKVKFALRCLSDKGKA